MAILLFKEFFLESYATFVTTLISGRLDLERKARDYFNILGCRKLRIINEINRNEVTT